MRDAISLFISLARFLEGNREGRALAIIEVSVLIVYIAGRHWVVQEYERNSIKQLPAQ